MMRVLCEVQYGRVGPPVVVSLTKRRMQSDLSTKAMLE